MTEIKYPDLTNDHHAELEKWMLNDTGCQYRMYLIDDAGAVVGYREPKMFSQNQPVTWCDALDVRTGKPMAEQPPAPKIKPLGKSRMPKPEVLMQTIDPLRPQIQWIKIDDILPSTLNPRTSFDPAKLDDLKASFLEHGFTPELSHLLLRPHPTIPGRYELVRGERRWRVAGQLHAANTRSLAGTTFDLSPAVVSEMTDAKALEYNLIEQLNHDDLSALDEADGICKLLDLRGGDGKPLHTAKALASKIGRSVNHISECRNVRRLRGSKAGEAVASGKLSWSHAKLLGRLPGALVRDELAARVIQHSLPREALEEIITNDIMKELRGLDWETADALLVPIIYGNPNDPEDRTAGGACDGCLFVHQASPQSVRMCMHPECFRMKKAAAHDRWAAEIEAQGKKVLTAEDADGLFDGSFQNTKRLSWNSGYVELDDKPGEHELKAAVTEAPKWKALVKGQGVPVFVVRDPAGKVREIVKRDAALVAAISNEHDIFKKATSTTAAAATEARDEEGIPAVESAAAAVRRDAENLQLERQRVREARIAISLDASLFEAARGLKDFNRTFWRLIGEPMVDALSEQGELEDVAEALGIRDAASIEWQELRDMIETRMAKGPEENLPGMILMIASRFLYLVQRQDWVKSAAKMVGLDTKAVVKRVDGEIAAELRAQAEAAEIEGGMTWVAKREKAAEFEWDGINAISPDVCEVKTPGDVRQQVSIFAARGKTGWHAGWQILNGKSTKVHPCLNRPPDYNTRELAVKCALLEILAHYEQAKLPGAVARLKAYIDGIIAPAPKKGAKKKGAK